jgi:putative selenate reductase
VQSPLTLEQGIREASRCFQCDEVCSVCTTLCPNLALMTYEVNPAKFELQKIKVNTGNVEILWGEAFEIFQKYQILHIADWCNKCGNCNTFCPTSGAPYLEKPHLFFNKEYFDSDNDGFFFDGKILLGKFDGILFSIEETEYGFHFQSDQIELSLNKDLHIENHTILKEEDFELDLNIAAQMKVILEGVQNLTGLPPEIKQ